MSRLNRRDTVSSCRLKKSQAAVVLLITILAVVGFFGYLLYLRNARPIQAGYVRLSGSVNVHGYQVSNILFTSEETGQQIVTTIATNSYSVNLPNHNWYDIRVEYSFVETYTGSYTGITKTDTVAGYCSPPRLLVNVTSDTMNDDITC